MYIYELLCTAGGADCRFVVCDSFSDFFIPLESEWRLGGWESLLTLIHLASKTIQDTWGGVKNTPLFQIALRLAEVVSEGNNHYK